MTYRASFTQLLAISFLLSLAGAAYGASDCAYRWKTDCAGTAPQFGCQNGCESPVPLRPEQGEFFGTGRGLFHAGTPCTDGGSFNLIGTRYEVTCPTLPDCLPPIRFWDHDNFGGPGGGNSGCQIRNPESAAWLVNWGGRWTLDRLSWMGPGIDGCAGGRTVVEVSDLDAAEGTIGHGSWFLVAAVDEDPGSEIAWDFGRLTGGLAAGGCRDNDVPVAPVPALHILGRSAACIGSAVVSPATPNPVDADYLDISVAIADPFPVWYTESGANGTPALIAGFQVLYASGPEPISSAAGSGWLPARDPVNPTQLALGYVPYGVSTPFSIALPRAGTPHWIATRLVYAAGSAVNPDGPQPLGSPGPRVTSFLGSHCGPIGQAGDCLVPALGVPGRLSGKREGLGARFSWLPATGAPEYHLNSVRNKRDLVDPGPHRTDRLGGRGDAQCEVPQPATSCLDPDAIGDGTILYYQAFEACGPNGVDEGPID